MSLQCSCFILKSLELLSFIVAAVNGSMLLHHNQWRFCVLNLMGHKTC